MTANLTAGYLAAEQKFKKAKTIEERIEALEEMLATVPKHKGTEKLQADIKRRLSKTKTEAAERPKGKQGFSVHVDKEGAGQMALAGLPNCGKSALVDALTNARCESADYPFTTRKPAAGMMLYEDIQIQLVDLPPVSDEYMEFWVPMIIRNADRVLLVLDLASPDPLADYHKLASLLEAAKIVLLPAVEEESKTTSIAQKRTLLAAARADLDKGGEMLQIVKELLPAPFRVIPVSVHDQQSLAELKQQIFLCFDIIRVYTKRPGHDADLHQPYVLPIGSTVLDVARTVHKELVERLRFARIWGSAKLEGMKVQRDFVLQDKDIVELNL